MIEADFSFAVGSFRLDVRLEGGPGVLVLYGPSGAGKSLTLRVLAGLLCPCRGRVAVRGRTVSDSERRIWVPAERRHIGWVPQQYALFSHLTARQNIAYGLRAWRSGDRLAKERRVAEVAELLGIAPLLERYPDQCSGGQQQRVALARALAPEPELLLLDEPFSNLDPAIRVVLRKELRRLIDRLGLAVVMVTHDREEAYNLADRVAVLSDGRVLQQGDRDEVFRRPISGQVALLTGWRNLVGGVVRGSDGEALLVDTPWGPVRAAAGAFAEEDRVEVAIRPERVLLVRPERNSRRTDTVLHCRIVDEQELGPWHTLELAVLGSEGPVLECDVPDHPYQVMGVRNRREWDVVLPASALHCMASSGEATSSPAYDTSPLGTREMPSVDRTIK